MVEDYWGPSLKMLSDFKFLENLKAFDKDNIPPALIKKIRDKYLTFYKNFFRIKKSIFHLCPLRFIKDREFVPEKIRTVSTACEGLCCWVRAMDVYDKGNVVTKIESFVLVSIFFLCKSVENCCTEKGCIGCS